MTTEDIYQLWLPENRKGVRLPRSKYLKFAQLLVLFLKDAEEHSLPFTVLFEKVSSSIVDENNFSWYFLQVKLDLQARGIITVSINRREKIQEIQLNAKKLKNSRIQKILDRQFARQLNNE